LDFAEGLPEMATTEYLATIYASCGRRVPRRLAGRIEKNRPTSSLTAAADSMGSVRN
jgi:hypothetical protein